MQCLIWGWLQLVGSLKLYSIQENTSRLLLHPTPSTEWQRPIGCLQLRVSFRKRATNHRALLLKMNHEDKASSGSSPPCIMHPMPNIRHFRHYYAWLGILLVSSSYSCVAVCCSVLQCVAVCCSVLQCVAVCCSVLQCAAVCCQYEDDTNNMPNPHWIRHWISYRTEYDTYKTICNA